MALYHYWNSQVGTLGVLTSIPLVDPQICATVPSLRALTDSVITTRLQASFSVFVDGTSVPTEQWWQRTEVYVGAVQNNLIGSGLPPLEGRAPNFLLTGKLKPVFAKAVSQPNGYTVRWDLPDVITSHAQRKGAGGGAGEPVVSAGFYVYDFTGELGSTLHHHQIFAEMLLEVLWGSVLPP